MRKIITCSHCNYRWFTQSELKLVTCPNCGLKTPNPYEKKIPTETTK